jgi:hypothetical protein
LEYATFSITNLQEKEKIEPPQVSEAIQYRSLDRQLWV